MVMVQPMRGSVLIYACMFAAAGDRSGAQIVDDTLRAAAARGINTVRMWAHTTNSIYPFQVRSSSHVGSATGAGWQAQHSRRRNALL